MQTQGVVLNPKPFLLGFKEEVKDVVLPAHLQDGDDLTASITNTPPSPHGDTCSD